MEKDKLTLRPTKKQRALLVYIESFIAEHGYSPSYREIMAGLDYNSVATVALHINSLIKRGHIRKRDYSARSLEVLDYENVPKLPTNEIKPSEEKWLIEKIEYCFGQVEQSALRKDSDLDELYVLIGALKVLGLEGAAQSFMPRLSALKARLS